MNRDIFNRGPRMTHKFGETERRNDPLGARTFDLPRPTFPRQRSAPVTVHQHGEHRYFDARSPVQKPSGGLASLSGPAPDLPGMVAAPIPVSTRRRHSGGKRG
jgi:hypothetical protein